MKLKQSLLLMGISWLVNPLVLADTNHYWSNQYGPRASLMGGAVLGGVDDSSAAYYNPAAVAYLPNRSFSTSANGYQFSQTRLNHVAGSNNHMDTTDMDILPLLISGSFDVADVKSGYLVITKNRNNFSGSSRVEQLGDLVASSNGRFVGDELYRGQLNFSQTDAEYWAGISWGKEINDQIAVGVSALGAWQSYDHHYTLSARASNVSAANDFATQEQTVRAKGLNLSLLAKLGVSYQNERLKLGATVTTPNARLFGKGTVEGSRDWLTPTSSLMGDDRQEDVRSNYRKPMSIALGGE